ncbi:MAG: choice-of-anchor Q domain-containing protein, partial [Sediminibacterium sp.]|nr:choice-of-anchor Q domain-containing protein [Sediminibacterium sp.]
MKRIVLPKKPLIWLIFLNCFNCLNAQTTYYVDASRPDNTGAGTSWTTAKKDVQNAITLAASGDQIWVKAGIYKPTQDPFGNTAPADPRDKTFLIKNGVKLYGGFAGTETLLSQRNPSLNVTQLSGDIGSAAVTDNCYHVVISLTSTSATVLDGFIVTSGYGVGAGNITVSGISISRYDGAGIYIRDGSPVINNCTVKDNTIDDVTGNDDTRGSGIYCWNSAPTVSNCVIANNTFLQNSFGCFGAGIGLFGNGVPQITNTYFYNNVTPPGMLGGAPGGGLYAEYSSPIITNCVFYGNVADNGGAIAVNGPSSPTITNCTLNNNTARYNGSGVVYFVVGSGIIKNTIFWNNPTTLTSYLNRMEIFSANTTATKPVITNCLVRDAVGAPLTVTNTVMSNCINANPQFFNAADPDGVDNRIGTTDDGLMLLNTSPAINVGATGAGIPLTDMALQTRDAQPDMGAYEYITPCTVPTVFTVTGGGTVCAGSGAAVSLSGSQSGISYQLKLNGSNQGSPLTGNGGALNFGTQTLAGNYAVVATNTAGAGCSAAMNGTVTITVNSTSAPSGSASQTFCAGATLANVVVSGTAIKWYTASVAGSLLSTTTALANGTSYYASQTLNGCESSTRLMVTVVVNPLPVISVNSGSICSGNAFTIVPTGASTYTIQGGNNVVSPLTNSTYTVSGTSAAGCISSGFVTSSVTVNALPVISVNSGSICSGNTFTIVPTGAST